MKNKLNPKWPGELRWATFKPGDVVRLKKDVQAILVDAIGRVSCRVISISNEVYEIEAIGDTPSGQRNWIFTVTMRNFELDPFMTAAAKATEDADE